jgi:hypothetical protein
MNIPLPALSQIIPAIAQLDATPAQKAALTEAFTAGRICVKAISGGFFVGSFTCGNQYVVTDRCSCASRVQPCKHRLVIRVLELAHRPAMAYMPPLAETLERADRLIAGLDTMPALAPKSKAQADREMAELFN